MVACPDAIDRLVEAALAMPNLERRAMLSATGKYVVDPPAGREMGFVVSRQRSIGSDGVSGFVGMRVSPKVLIGNAHPVQRLPP